MDPGFQTQDNQPSLFLPSTKNCPSALFKKHLHPLALELAHPERLETLTNSLLRANILKMEVYNTEGDFTLL